MTDSSADPWPGHCHNHRPWRGTPGASSGLWLDSALSRRGHLGLHGPRRPTRTDAGPPHSPFHQADLEDRGRHQRPDCPAHHPDTHRRGAARGARRGSVGRILVQLLLTGPAIGGLIIALGALLHTPNAALSIVLAGILIFVIRPSVLSIVLLYSSFARRPAPA